MKLIKDEGLKVQVEITQEDWVALLDCLMVYADTCKAQAEAYRKYGDEETAKDWEGWKEWKASPAALLDVMPKDFLEREGNSDLSITNK